MTAAKRVSRFVAVLGLGIALAVPVTIAGGRPAAAAVPDLSCTGFDSVTYEPPLRLTSDYVVASVEHDYDYCSGAEDLVWDGTMAFQTPPVYRSCRPEPLVIPAAFTFEWTGPAGIQTSRFAGVLSVGVPVDGHTVGTFTGNIVAGLFEDSLATLVVVSTAPDPLACLFGAVESSEGPVTLLIASP